MSKKQCGANYCIHYEDNPNRGKKKDELGFCKLDAQSITKAGRCADYSTEDIKIRFIPINKDENIFEVHLKDYRKDAPKNNSNKDAIGILYDKYRLFVKYAKANWYAWTKDGFGLSYKLVDELFKKYENKTIHIATYMKEYRIRDNTDGKELQEGEVYLMSLKEWASFSELDVLGGFESQYFLGINNMFFYKRYKNEKDFLKGCFKLIKNTDKKYGKEYLPYKYLKCVYGEDNEDKAKIEFAKLNKLSGEDLSEFFTSIGGNTLLMQFME